MRTHNPSRVDCPGAAGWASGGLRDSPGRIRARRCRRWCAARPDRRVDQEGPRLRFRAPDAGARAARCPPPREMGEFRLRAPRSMDGPSVLPIAPANRCHSGQNVRVWIAVKMWTTRGRALPVHREPRTPILAPAVGPSVVALRVFV